MANTSPVGAPPGWKWDPVQGKWVQTSGSNVQYAGNTLLAQQNTADQGGTMAAGSSPSGQQPYVPPPAGVNTGQTQGPDTVTSPRAATAQTQTPSILSDLNFDAELDKLLGNMNKLSPLEEQVTGGMDTDDWTQNDQAMLDESIALARREAGIRDRQAENTLAAANLRGGGSLVRRYQETTDNLAASVLDASIRVRSAASQRNAAAREAAKSRAATFAKYIRDGNGAAAQALLQAYAADREAELTREQMDISRMQIEENIRLSRDKFTEEQRKALVAEGFTDKQISSAEEQMIWERGYRERQQMADIDLAQKNYDLQNKALAASTSYNDRMATIAEIKNNADISLNDRVFELQKEFGLSDREFDREKFEAMTEQIEREFGLQMNQFALEKTIRTGELDLNILNSQRRYDLDKEDQKQKWLATEAARQTQELLGMTELEIRKSLGEGQLSIQREQQILEKYFFDTGLNWEKQKFKQQLEAARKKEKGGLLGKIIKNVAGVGMGIAGVVTGNPALIAAGVSTTFGGAGGGDISSMINGLMPVLGPIVSPGGGGDAGSAMGDWDTGTGTGTGTGGGDWWDTSGAINV